MSQNRIITVHRYYSVTVHRCVTVIMEPHQLLALRSTIKFVRTINTLDILIPFFHLKSATVMKPDRNHQPSFTSFGLHVLLLFTECTYLALHRWI